MLQLCFSSPLNSLITIGILYSSPMSEGTVLTLQIDVLKYGEDVVSDFKMPIKISEHDRFGGFSALAGISTGGRTDLHIAMRGMMTGVRYRDEILDVYVRPYAGAIGPQFILKDDNARPHHARVVEDISSMRPSSMWIGQHVHPMSTRPSTFGTCYRWRFC